MLCNALEDDFLLSGRQNTTCFVYYSCPRPAFTIRWSLKRCCNQLPLEVNKEQKGLTWFWSAKPHRLMTCKQRSSSRSRARAHRQYSRVRQPGPPVAVRRVSEGVVRVSVLHPRTGHVRATPVGRPPRHARRAAALAGPHGAGHPAGLAVRVHALRALHAPRLLLVPAGARARVTRWQRHWARTLAVFSGHAAF